MKSKDPYLSELDALGDLSVEEKTDTHIESPVFSEKETESRPSNPVSKEALQASVDVPVQIVVVMGRKEIVLKDLIDLRPGQVVELEKGAHDSVDLVANGRVIAKGELVEIDGKLGVRVLKILK